MNLTRRELFKLGGSLIMAMGTQWLVVSRRIWATLKTKYKFFPILEISAQDNFELGGKLKRVLQRQIQLIIKIDI